MTNLLIPLPVREPAPRNAERVVIVAGDGSRAAHVAAAMRANSDLTVVLNPLYEPPRDSAVCPVDLVAYGELTLGLESPPKAPRTGRPCGWSSVASHAPQPRRGAQRGS